MSETSTRSWEQFNEAGRRFFSLGDLTRAEESFVAAIDQAEALGPDAPQLASSLSNLGQLRYQQRDLDGAEGLFRRALAIRERIAGGDPQALGHSINNLAALLVAKGDMVAAEPLLQRALSLSERRLETAEADLAVNLNNLAKLCFKRSDFAQAEPLLTRVLLIKQKLGRDHPEVAAVLTSLAKVRMTLGRFDHAERLWRRVVQIRQQTLNADDPAIATALENLADACAAQGRQDDALALRERALGIRETSLGADHASLSAVRARLEDLRQKLRTNPNRVSVAMPRVSGQLRALDFEFPETSGDPVHADGAIPTTSAEVRAPAAPIAAAHAAPAAHRSSGKVEAKKVTVHVKRAEPSKMEPRVKPEIPEEAIWWDPNGPLPRPLPPGRTRAPDEPVAAMEAAPVAVVAQPAPTKAERTSGPASGAAAAPRQPLNLYSAPAPASAQSTQARTATRVAPSRAAAAEAAVAAIAPTPMVHVAAEPAPRPTPSPAGDLVIMPGATSDRRKKHAMYGAVGMAAVAALAAFSFRGQTSSRADLPNSANGAVQQQAARRVASAPIAAAVVVAPDTNAGAETQGAARAEPARSTPARPEPRTSPREAASLPRLNLRAVNVPNLDGITRAIDDSARRRLDSATKVNARPPSFRP